MKKVIAILLTIAIVLTIGYFVIYKQDASEQAPVREQSIIVEGPVLLFESMNEPELSEYCTTVADNYKEMIAATEGYKFISYEKDNEGHVAVYAVPESTLEEMYSVDLPQGRLLTEGSKKEDDPWNMILKKAIVLAEHATEEEAYFDDKTAEAYAINYNRAGKVNSAYGNIFEGNKTVFNYFEDECLDIYVENAEIRKIIGSPDIVDLEWEVIAVVDADVTTVMNAGAFKDVSWIPKEGKTANIEFILVFSSYNCGGWHEIEVQDIGVME